MGYANIHSADGIEAFKRSLEVASVASVAHGNLTVDEILGMREDHSLAAFRLIRFHDTKGIPKCPRCESTESYTLTKRHLVWACAHCGHQYTMTNGTMLHGRKMGMRAYLCFLSMVMDKQQFRSLLQFSQEAKIGYKTAHAQINRFRACMAANNGCSVPFSLLEREAFNRRWAETRSNLTRFMFDPKNASYPYLSEDVPKDYGRGLLEFVNKLMPRWMPDYLRADACQDMIVAILTGEATTDQIKKDARKYLTKIFAEYPWKYKWLSLDAPRSEDDERTFGESLSNEDYENAFQYARPVARPVARGAA